ncbi:MAG: Rpn family recombination-promoting nuclease/putative transposase, partial [Clostridia bacterium]|nr:Rpn family recombination-promoting nuclease/putative transposase [Clostridia bacterium]
MNNETITETSEQNNKKLLDPKIDAVFQILFSKNNLDITKALLSAILGLEIKQLTNKTLSLDLNKILDRTYPLDKIGVLDLRAQINNEIELDLEMQMLNKEALIERILWYWSKMYSSQLSSGDDYPKLKKTIEILIVNEPIPKLETIEKPCTKWHIREEELCSFVLTNKLEIIIIELPKVKQAFLEKPESLLYQWM